MRLAQFPLELVVYPGEPLNLHIFEGRYKDLMEDIRLHGINFGITPVVNKSIMKWGTELQVVDIVKTYEDGRLDVKCMGLRAYTVDDYIPNSSQKSYDSAQVTQVKLDVELDPSKNIIIKELAAELFTYLDQSKTFPEANDVPISYAVAHYVGFTLHQEYEFLKIRTESERQDVLIKHINRIIPTARSLKDTKDRIAMNGHFKEIKPPKL